MGAKKKQQQLAHQVETQNADIKKLESTIHDAETERQNQKREYENVISDRDILGTQLIRRNDELSLLYEKIKIQQSTLQKARSSTRVGWRKSRNRRTMRAPSRRIWPSRRRRRRTSAISRRRCTICRGSSSRRGQK